MSYIEFYEQKTNTKTKVISVIAKSSGHEIGQIKWFGRWRQYCFFPEDSIWSDGCLVDVINYIKGLKKERQAAMAFNKNRKFNT